MQSFSYTGSVQTFTVPANVYTITIEAVGGGGGGGGGGCGNGTAGAGGPGGAGAVEQGDFSVTPGQVLSVLVGAGGSAGAGGNGSLSAYGGHGGGGGGGSFVWTGTALGPTSGIGGTDLIAAGGGGGGGGDTCGTIGNKGGAGGGGIGDLDVSESAGGAGSGGGCGCGGNGAGGTGGDTSLNPGSGGASPGLPYVGFQNAGAGSAGSGSGGGGGTGCGAIFCSQAFGGGGGGGGGGILDSSHGAGFGTGGHGAAQNGAGGVIGGSNGGGGSGGVPYNPINGSQGGGGGGGGGNSGGGGGGGGAEGSPGGGGGGGGSYNGGLNRSRNSGTAAIHGSGPAGLVVISWQTSAGSGAGRYDTSSTVTSSANPSVFGQAVTFTATICCNQIVNTSTGSSTLTPTGTVTFCFAPDNGAILSGCGGSTSSLGTVPLSAGRKATLTTSSLPVGASNVVAKYNGDSNFLDSSSNFGVRQVVNKPTTNISAAPATAAYGDANVTLSATVSSDTALVNEGSVSFTVVDANNQTVGAATSGSVSNDGVAVSYALPSGTAAGSYTIKASYTDSGGAFTASSNSGQSPAAMLTITKANQAISFAAGTATAKSYGDPNFTVSASGGGSGNPVTFSSSSGACTVSAAGSVHIVSAGSCLIAADQAGNANYNAAPEVTTTVSIAKANQSITVGTLVPSSAVYGSSFTIAANAGSSLPVSIGVSGACSLGGGTVTMTSGTGTCTVTFDQAGNGNYNAAPQVVETAAAQPAPLAVTADSLSRVYGQPNPTLTFKAVGFVGNDTAATALTGSLTTSATAASPVNQVGYPITQGTLAAANYSISFSNGTLTITPAPLTVTANNASKVYGAALPTLTGTLTGVVSGDGITASYSTTATTASPVLQAGYPITATLTDPNSKLGNYTVTNSPATLTITPAPLTVTVNDATRIYGVANPSFSAGYSGFVNGDDPSKLSGTLAFSTSATPTSDPGSYPVSASGLSGNNYTISYKDGTLIITKAPATITLGNLSATYDGQPHPATATTSPAGLSGVTLSFSQGGSPVAAPTHAGSYAVIAHLEHKDYQAPDATGTLVIAKANQTISFAPLGGHLLGQPAFSLSATASSGLAVSFSTTSTACSLSTQNGATSVTLLAAGPCSIAAHQAGNGDYNLAPDVTQSFTTLQVQGPSSPFQAASQAGGQPSITRQVGSTLPVKFQLTDGSKPITNATGKVTINGVSVAFGGLTGKEYHANVQLSGQAGQSYPVVVAVDGYGNVTIATVTLK